MVAQIEGTTALLRVKIITASGEIEAERSDKGIYISTSGDIEVDTNKLLTALDTLRDTLNTE